MTEASARARQVADAMYQLDRVAQGLEITIEDVALGYARATMLVRDHMSNSHGTCHGGMIFSLADTAFGYACNAANQLTVASSCDISFVSPAKTGTRLVAVARERALGGKSGVYDVEVSDEAGSLVALFRGRSYRLRGNMVPGI